MWSIGSDKRGSFLHETRQVQVMWALPFSPALPGSLCAGSAATQNILQAVTLCSSWSLVPLCPLEHPMLQDTENFAEVMVDGTL